MADPQPSPTRFAGTEPRAAGDEPVVSLLEASIRRRYRRLELKVREGTILIGHDGRVVDSIKIEDWLGIGEIELRGDHPLPTGWKMFDHRGAPLPLSEHPALVTLRTGERCERVVTYEPPGQPVSPRGRRRLRLVAYPVHDDPEVAVDLVVADHDRRRHSRRLLESQETRFRTMTDMLAVAVWESSTSGEVTYVNPKFVEMTGLDLSTAPDLPMLEIVHPDDLVAVMGAANAAARNGAYQAQYRLMHVDGSSRWVNSKMSVLADDDGNINGFVGVIEDIDDLRRSEQRAGRLAEIVEAAADAVLVFENRALVYVNRSAASLLARLDPSFTTDLASYRYSNRLLERLLAIESLLVRDGIWSGDTEFVDLDGDRVDLALTITTESDDDSMRHVVMAHDIGKRKLREAELTHHAAHDPLTGLANRHRLTEVIAETDDDLLVGLLFVDLDHFKQINDDHGHVAGDRVLKVAAQRVVAAVDSGHLVARVGGDEMVVWAPGVPEVESLAHRIVSAVGDRPVVLEGSTCRVSATVGGALGRAGDHMDLMRRADEALYEAKRDGRRRARVADD